ncbi:hypothetical protein [Undibacterium sp. TJN19]
MFSPDSGEVMERKTKLPSGQIADTMPADKNKNCTQISLGEHVYDK